MGLWMWTQKKVVATSKWNLFPFTVSIATQHIVTVSTSSRLKFFPGFKNFCLLKGVWYKLSTNLTNKMAYEVFWLVCGNWWGSFHLHDLLSCKRKNRSCNLFAGHAEARFGPTRYLRGTKRPGLYNAPTPVVKRPRNPFLFGKNWACWHFFQNQGQNDFP